MIKTNRVKFILRVFLRIRLGKDSRNLQKTLHVVIEYRVRRRKSIHVIVISKLTFMDKNIGLSLEGFTSLFCHYK